jgi:hypothetical protein
MNTKLGCAAGAVLLLSASFSFAIPLNGSVSGAKNISPLAPIEIASRHSSSSSARPSSSSARSSSRPSSRPSSAASRAYTVGPYRSSASPRFSNSTPFYARPQTRLARRLAPLGRLSAIYIGSRYYYAYRYLPYDGPICSGVSVNGCEMQWMEVPTEDGEGTVPQCVEFCPQQ